MTRVAQPLILSTDTLYPTVADQGISITRRVIQIGESKMPFVPLRTLLVHDKALLGVLPEEGYGVPRDPGYDRDRK